MRSSYLVSSTENVLPDVDLLGGKASSLVELARLGLPVPPWFCVTTQVLDEVLAQCGAEIAGVVERIRFEDRESIRAGSQEARQRLACAVPGVLDCQEVLERFDAMFGREAKVAVRSSAVAEDSKTDSFAGQLDTVLFVGRERLSVVMSDCLSSAFSERALVYAQARRLGKPGRFRAAVLIQSMVQSRVSGVLFTANPTTGDRTEAVVSAALGLGEGVVAGLVESDTYYADLESGAVRRRSVLEKRTHVAFDSARAEGTCVAKTCQEDASASALSDEQLAWLIQAGKAVDRARGCPQDIEWAIDSQGSLYLLQARPVTTLTKGRETIFDNANVVESYPGLTLPLTFSFVRSSYEDTFREASRRFGVADSVLEERASVHANLVGLIDGRVFYNILNWYELFRQIPGLEGALPAWEKALGLTPRQVRAAPRTGVWARFRLIARILKLFFFLPEQVRAYLTRLHEAQTDFRKIDLDDQEAHEIIDMIDAFARRLRRPYAVSVINDFFASQLVDLVAKLISRWELGAERTLLNELLCGQKDMESVAPVHSILGLTARIRDSEGLRALFASETLSPEETWVRIHREPEFAEFRAALTEHLSRYGDRTLHELKLETPPAEDNPKFIVTMLKNYLAGGQTAEDFGARERSIRHQAEASVRARLARHPLRRLLFRIFLAYTRRSVVFRENLRFARSRAYGMVKRLYRALGKRLCEVGLLDDPQDVLYLGEEEARGLVIGHALPGDARALVELRKEEYRQYGARSPASRTITRGIVRASSRAEANASGVESGSILRGTPCSPGQVTAAVKVINSPDQNLEIRGEILVAPMTDPGWVFLMVAAKGIVAERGSPLSHTAIIGRELGIPTIVGVKDATRCIRDGQVIEMDGESGEVRLQPG